MIVRMIVFSIALLMFAPAAAAKKKKTVEIKDRVATDLKYGWSMEIPKNWKANSMKEPNIERLYLEKRNYQVNRYILTYGGDYTVPSVLIYVQEFNGTIDDFEALLKRSLYEHRSENELISRMEMIMDCEFITSGDVIIDSVRARQVYVKRNYDRVLYVEDDIKYINDHEVHEIYLIKRDNLIYVIQAYCEREFYEVNSAEFHSLIESLTL